MVSYYKYLFLSLLIGGGICSHVNAQVTVDGTTNTTLETTNGGTVVNNGDRAGNNLFHSFSEFSVPNGSSASFNNAVEIENIFSRVTGGNISDINGAINANGGANLLLINPAGIVFGENATLNVGGSFFATTADSLLLEEGEFSAINPQAAPVLTINRPIGLNFGNNSGDIINRANFGLTTTSIDIGLIPEFEARDSVGLQVNDGETISLIGGDITLENAGGITASGGTVELGGLSQEGVVSINADGNLEFPEGVERGNVTLTEQSRVNVSADGGGFININARNLELSQQSELRAGITEDSNSQANAGDINIDATDSVRILGEPFTSTTESFEEDIEAQTFARDYGTGIRNTVGLPSVRRNSDRSSSIGNGGNINISTTTLELQNVAIVDTSIFGTGNGGDINIDASNISLSGELSAFLAQIKGFDLDRIKEQGVGDGGDLNINTGSISFNELTGILLDVQSGARGNGGDVNINATEDVSFINESGFTFVITQLAAESIGSAGDINISAGSFTANPTLLILADTQGTGDAGNINISAEKTIALNSTQVQSQAINDAVGDAGDISITTGDSFIVDDGSLILADTQAVGDGGNITITAGDRIVLQGLSEAGFPSQFVAGLSRPNSQGTGGIIEINAGELTLDDVAFITSNSVPDSVGEAGNIIINVDRLQLQENSLINTFTGNKEPGGEIAIDAQNIELIKGGKILAATDSGGDGGNINLNVTEGIAIDNSVEATAPFIEIPESPLLNELQSAPSGIYADATENATGNSGNIVIGANSNGIPQEVNLIDDGQIVVSSEGAGSGGNIFINSQNLKLESNANISAATVFGRGGEVTLSIGDSLTLRDNSTISARAFAEADGGNLAIDTNLIFAFPNQNNDIIANAQQGSGGNIDLTAESIIGIQERSSNPPNNTNDLDVSSELSIDGTVTINNPDVDPTAGIVELPTVPIDAEAILAQDLCKVENEDIAGGSSFIVTGKGGLTPTSAESLDNRDRVVNWADETVDIKDGVVSVPKPKQAQKQTIVQSQGIAIASDGSLWLTANANHATPHNSNNHPDCQS